MRINQQARAWTGATMGSLGGHASFLLLARFVSRRVCGLLLVPITLFYYLAVPRARTSGSAYVQRRFSSSSGAKRFVIGWLHVLAFAETILDNVYLLVRGPACFSVDFPTTSRVREAVSLGKGVIILSAHVGNWQVAARFFRRLEVPTTVVMYQAERPEISRLYAREAPAGNGTFRTLFSNDPLEAIIGAKQCLARGEIVLMHGDRTVSRGVVRRFLGAPATVPDFPIRLAAATGAPVVVAFSARIGPQHYCTEAQPHFFVSPDTVEEGIDRFLGYLEGYLDKNPLQWFNFYDFWGSHGN